MIWMLSSAGIMLSGWDRSVQSGKSSTLMASTADTGGMNINALPHPARDEIELVAAGVDPCSTQPRDRQVSCNVCDRLTMFQAGGCDRHYVAPWAARRACGQVTVSGAVYGPCGTIYLREGTPP